MKFIARININPLKEILDPQGKAVMESLKKIGINTLHDVRIGKHIVIEIEAPNKADAQSQIENACKLLLANPIMEFYHFTIEEMN